MTDEQIEAIAAKIDSEGFDYYFNDYGPDEALKASVGQQIEAYKKASKDLRDALYALGIEA